LLVSVSGDVLAARAGLSPRWLSPAVTISDLMAILIVVETAAAIVLYVFILRELSLQRQLKLAQVEAVLCVLMAATVAVHLFTS